jgi:hypothetical protein
LTFLSVKSAASCIFDCLQDASLNSSTISTSTTNNDTSNVSSTFWLWLFGLGTLALAAGSTYATYSTFAAAACVVSRLLEQTAEPQPETPLRLAMSAAALLVALPQLALVTGTMA